jgi:hypothetical protein
MVVNLTPHPLIAHTYRRRRVFSNEARESVQSDLPLQVGHFMAYWVLASASIARP